MEKVYIMREVCFIHNDIENVRVGLGDVVGVFDRYDQAYEAYLICERQQHQTYHIVNFELMRTIGKGILGKMQYFFQKHFPKMSDFKEILQMPHLPAEATLAQTATFIQISGVQHYDLSVHEQMPAYYKIKMADDFWGEEEDFSFTVFPTEVSALYSLQESLEKATYEALGVAFSYLWHDMLEETDYDFAGMQGKLMDLSQTPDMLAAYLQDCANFWYDVEKQKIRFSPNTEDDATESVVKELVGLFSLLVLTPFHITPIDLEAMRNQPVKIGKREEGL